MHTDFERLFYTEDYRKNTYLRLSLLLSYTIYVMGDNQKRCQMNDEVNERNITLEMTVLGFFFLPVKLAKVYYVAMAAIGRMDCSSEDRIFG